jgi:hypothetical protein
MYKRNIPAVWHYISSMCVSLELCDDNGAVDSQIGWAVGFG